MAHLWMKNDSDAWALLALDAGAFGLRRPRPRRLATPVNGSAHAYAAILRRVDGPDGAIWTLVSRPGAGVSVNGVPSLLGVVVLADRDEIRAPDLGSVFFSTETLARVEPFPASGPRVFCPRCKLEIETGTPAVRCPGCGLWHHESPDLACWTYDVACTTCPVDTALDAGFRWTPEEV